jgi:hypothetical protein
MQISIIRNAALAGILFIAIIQSAFGQPGGTRPAAEGSIYGKVLDGDTKKPLEFAVIQLLVAGEDSSRKLVNGALSAHNGDFRMDKVTIGQTYLLTITLIGFEPQEIMVNLSKGGGGLKDVGNVLLEQRRMYFRIFRV